MQRLWALAVLPSAVLVGFTFGGCFRAVAEYSKVYVFSGVLIGTIAALAVRGFPLVGAASSFFGSVIVVLIAKLIVGVPASAEGMTWLEYHTTLFDFIFCYTMTPMFATATGGVGALVLAHLWPRRPTLPKPNP